MFHPTRTELADTGKTALLILAFPLAGLGGCGSEVAGPNPSRQAATVTLSAPALTIRSGTSASVSAILRDSAGNSLSGRTIAWTSSDPLVATVRAEPAQSVTVAAVGVGDVTITASVDGVTAALTFGVTPSTGPLGRMRGFLYSASEGFAEILAISGGSDVLPTDINDAGQVVGSFVIGQSNRAFLWTRAGGMTDLGVPDGWRASVALAVNSTGIVVGYVWRVPDPEDDVIIQHAFRWSSTTGMVILPFPGIPLDINTQGDIVGYTWAGPESGYRPIRWSTNGTVNEIGNFRSDSGGIARAINDNGQIAGARFSRSYSPHYYPEMLPDSRSGSIPTVWDADGTVINIGNCGGCSAEAYYINGSGQVAGTTNGNAFYWSRAEGLTELGSRVGSRFSTSGGINSTGQVIVNRYYQEGSEPGVRRAFLWTRSTGERDIGLLTGTVSTSATAINNKGQIVGISR